MRIGCVRERKDGEERVGLTPEGVVALLARGHEVFLEHDAGAESGFLDRAYEAAGAAVYPEAGDVWAQSDLVVKVKEPIPEEYGWLHEGCALFGYLHLAADRPLTEVLLEKRVTAFAPELIRQPSGIFPLLAPMSQIAGRMAAEIGAQLLKRPGPGRGKLLGGIAGVTPGRAVVLGSGTVGTSAARVLVGLDAQVTMISDDLPRLRQIVEQFDGRVTTRVSTPATVADALAGADLVVLAVLVPGAHTPRVVTREMVRSMGTGAVLVDVSIDQGGASETSRVTTHSDPTYVDEGVVHYCVANMPGAVPQTSTLALTSASIPYVLAIADLGIEGAMRADRGLAESLSTYKGQLVHRPVAEEFGLTWTANPFLGEL
jgi:alanine dehydrogenase